MLPITLRRKPASAGIDLFRDPEAVFDRMLNLWGNGGALADISGEYPVDIHEDDTRIYVDAELPGFTREQVDVTLENGILRIVAERKQPAPNDKQKQHLHERRFTRVERAFTLPAAVAEDKVEAALKDGVLRISLQKAREAMPCHVAVK